MSYRNHSHNKSTVAIDMSSFISQHSFSSAHDLFSSDHLCAFFFFVFDYSNQNLYVVPIKIKNFRELLKRSFIISQKLLLSYSTEITLFSQDCYED